MATNLISHAMQMGGIPKTFKQERKHIISVAKDLRYGEEVIKQLKNATTSNELTKIMKTARTTWYN